MQNKKPVEAKKLLIYQALLTLIITLALLPLGAEHALSGFLGGMIVVTTSAVVLLMVFRDYTAQNPGKLMLGFYGAEIVKLTITMAAFAFIVLNVKPLSFITLFSVYFLIQIVPAVCLAAGK